MSASNRKRICAGNWKMYKSPMEAKHYLTEWASFGESPTGVDVVIFPPAYNLPILGEKAAASHVKFGPQNFYFESEGAFTGEISLDVCHLIGATYALVGHSERRAFFHETNEAIGKKVKRALDKGLIPVLCVGETLAEREADKTWSVIQDQLQTGLALVKEHPKASTIVVAYEPVWAIGTGRVASPAQAQEVHGQIRSQLKELLGQDTHPILYGGSVKPANAESLIKESHIDGFLVGGASLNPGEFHSILSALG